MSKKDTLKRAMEKLKILRKEKIILNLEVKSSAIDIQTGYLIKILRKGALTSERSE